MCPRRAWESRNHFIHQPRSSSRCPPQPRAAQDRADLLRTVPAYSGPCRPDPNRAGQHGTEPASADRQLPSLLLAGRPARARTEGPCCPEVRFGPVRSAPISRVDRRRPARAGRERHRLRRGRRTRAPLTAAQRCASGRHSRRRGNTRAPQPAAVGAPPCRPTYGLLPGSV